MAKEIVWTKRANNKFNKIIDYLENKYRTFNSSKLNFDR